MASQTERAEVLKLVEARQVTPEEGARLLAALADEKRPASRDRPDAPGRSTGRWFRLKVEESGGQQVNLTLPLVAVPLILRMARRWVPAEHREVLDSLAEVLTSDFRGEILQVNEPGGNNVRLWIE